MRLLRHIACLCTLTLMGAAAHGQISLDLNTAAGDQGERQREVKPGETFAIELLAAGGAKDRAGGGTTSGAICVARGPGGRVAQAARRR